MTEKPRLGGFLLDDPISSGGMGIVWRARHALTGRPVAIKVIAAMHARNPVYVDGFEREVRAVAGMYHPRIIRVHDYGTVDRIAEVASGGNLPSGAPWLAMEFAAGGSLAQSGIVSDFASLRNVLFDVLDALAHSHARNIVHRDLKPGNILVTGDARGIQFKLSDFGIAHANGRATSTREVFASSAGTPWYMAPEQVESRWRDYGPWTDLYALGCVAFELASGITPFTGESAVRVARQQLFDRPPRLEPRFEVPPGFAEWVDRLLVKEIPHRFRRAADAAWALRQLAAVTPSTDVAPVPPALGETETMTGEVTTPMSFDSEIATLTFLSPNIGSVPTRTMRVQPLTAAAASPFPRPPMPDDWRLSSEGSPDALVGAGIGLYRLREAPFVGRTDERDVLWAALEEAVEERTIRGVVVAGSGGSGKSRLSRWIAQRAHELGVASFLVARHSSLHGPGHGIGPMLQSYLLCAGLDFEQTFARVRRLLTLYTSESRESLNYFAAAITQIIHPGGHAPGVPIVRFASAEERFEPAIRVLQQLSERRPVVLVLEDVQWGYESLELARRMLGARYPLLVIATVRPDQLDGRPLERDAVRALEQEHDCRRIDLGPLSSSEHLELMDELLVLEPSLRQRVLDRTYGSPLFATELIGSWIRRGHLRSGPAGYRLETGIDLPDSLHDLWNERLDGAIRRTGDPGNARSALEVGATLGYNVSTSEWTRACARLGIEARQELIDILAESGFVERTEEGWFFSHQTLRDSVLNAADAAGRKHRYHRTIAEMFEFEDVAETQFRRALHLLAVDDFEGAALPLVHAARGMVQTGRVKEAAALSTYLDDVVTRLGEDHAAMPQVIQQRLRLLYASSDGDALAAYALQMKPLAQRHGWLAVLSSIHRALGHVAMERGDATTWAAELATSLDVARRSRDPLVIAHAHRLMAVLRIREGDLVAAKAHADAARDHFAIAGDTEGESNTLATLAEIERLEGDFDKARAHSDASIELARQHGHRWVLVPHLILSGELSMSQGAHQAAAHAFADASRLSEITNHSLLPMAKMNLALAWLRSGNTEDTRRARDVLTETYEASVSETPPMYTYLLRLTLLWCAAALNDRASWDADYDDIRRRASPDYALRDIYDHASFAVERWLAVGDRERALQCLELAEVLVPEGYRNTLAPHVAEQRERIEAAQVQVGAKNG